MARSIGAALFPDGTVKYTLYDGTSDVLWTKLFDTPAETWALYQAALHQASLSRAWDALQAEPEGEPEEVVLYTDHGGGAYWPGKATRNAVIGPTAWDDTRQVLTEGKPQWWLSL